MQLDCEGNPSVKGEPCCLAELHRLVDLVDHEVFGREPKTITEARERWHRIAATIRQLSLEQLKTRLGIYEG